MIRLDLGFRHKQQKFIFSELWGLEVRAQGAGGISGEVASPDLQTAACSWSSVCTPVPSSSYKDTTSLDQVPPPHDLSSASPPYTGPLSGTVTVGVRLKCRGLGAPSSGNNLLLSSHPVLTSSPVK